DTPPVRIVGCGLRIELRIPGAEGRFRRRPASELRAYVAEGGHVGLTSHAREQMRLEACPFRGARVRLVVEKRDDRRVAIVTVAADRFCHNPFSITAWLCCSSRAHA